MPSISHSEVSAYLSCRRKHFYNYTLSLQAVNTGPALAYGSAGHSVLEAYYATILAAGKSVRAQKGARKLALATARAAFTGLRFKQPDNKQSLDALLFDFYFANEPFVSKGWRIIGVEKRFSLEYDNDTHLQFPFVVDVIAVDPDGKTVVIDHKFIGEFYSVADTELMGQIPKYIGALRGLNHKVDYGVYNLLRTREIKTPIVEQLLRQIAVRPTNTRIVQTFREQIDIAEDIQAIKLDSPEEQDLKAYRADNKMTCKFCDFRDLCEAQLSGAPTKLLLANEYTTRTRQEFEVSEDVS